MSTAAIRKLYGKTEDPYLELVRRFPLRPLRSDDELDAAVDEIDELVDRVALSLPERDYLDVLSDLVEAYENESVPMRPVGDANLLRFLLKEKRVTQSEVAAKAGIAESVISEILSGKRRLNRSQIGKLARYFHVAPGAFLAGG